MRARPMLWQNKQVPCLPASKNVACLNHPLFFCFSRDEPATAIVLGLRGRAGKLLAAAAANCSTCFSSLDPPIPPLPPSQDPSRRPRVPFPCRQPLAGSLSSVGLLYMPCEKPKGDTWLPIPFRGSCAPSFLAVPRNHDIDPAYSPGGISPIGTHPRQSFCW